MIVLFVVEAWLARARVDRATFICVSEINWRRKLQVPGLTFDLCLKNPDITDRELATSLSQLHGDSELSKREEDPCVFDDKLGSQPTPSTDISGWPWDFKQHVSMSRKLLVATLVRAIARQHDRIRINCYYETFEIISVKSYALSSAKVLR